MNHNAKRYLLDAAARLKLDCVGTVSLPLATELSAILAADPSPCPFTPRDVLSRTQPERLLPDARSVIVILFPYRPANDTPLPAAVPDIPTPSGTANLARYTRSPDYHLIVHRYLERLQARLQAAHPQAVFYPFVDTSPLPDRYLAYAAGLGFFGWNHCLIHPRYGSYVVIGGLISTLDYPPDAPLNQSCFGCGRCVRACPGSALSPHQFDYRRCKSYLTQKKGALSPAEISILRQNPLIFGCDTCQDVCPHNLTAAPSPLPEFAEQRLDKLTLADLTACSNKTFAQQYGNRAFAWRGKNILIRNAKYLASSTLSASKEEL